jgi:hypothetical protein
VQLIEHTMVTSFDVSFNEPRERKLGDFSCLESLKKHKRKLHWGTFFDNSLVGSKKG